jgi:hypothetical protein
LLATDAGAVVRGVVLAEYARLLALFGPAAFASGVALGRLVGPAAMVTAWTAGALALATVVAVGYPLGLAAKLLIRAGRRRGIGWPTMAVAAGVPLLLAATRVGGLGPGALLDLAGWLPPGWYADLALSATGGGDRFRAVGVVVLSGAAVVGGAAAADRLAASLWYGDEVRTATVEHPGGLGRIPLPGVVGRPAAAVARVSWVRIARAPVKLVYTLYPLGGVIAVVVDRGVGPALWPPLFVYLPLYGAWAAGAGLALNPLGDEGAALPTTVTSTVTGPAFLSGHALAAALPGAAVGGAGAVAAAALGGLGPAVAVVGVALAAAFSATAAGVAATVGAAFPGFESVRIGADRRIVTPSFAASTSYFAVLGVASLPGLAAALSVSGVGTPLAAGGPATVGAALGVQALVAAGAVVAARRVGGRRFDRFTQG